MALFPFSFMQSQTPPYVGLLDLYPNAAAAYSVRKLRTAYTGSAIRVRRSSDNAESDIGFSGGNLDTTSLTSFCGAGNGFVTTWYDQSGNARNATQTTAANQPQIVLSGSVINENSKPCLDWNGSNFWLRTAAFSPTITQPVSYFITSQVDSVSNNVICDGVVNGFGLFYRSTSNNMTYDLGSSLLDSSVPNTQLLYSIIANTSSSLIYNNSSLELSGNLGTRDVGGFTLGNLATGLESFGYQLKGSLQEFVFYASNQNSNITGIQTNINSYYAIY